MCVKEDVLYNNLFINTDNISVKDLNEILDKLAKEEKLSANRRAYLNSSGEITINENIEEMIMLLLRLGYDIEFTTKDANYYKIIDEMLKTSYSVITFDLKSKIPFVEKYRKSKIKKQYNKVLGEIKFT